MASDFTNSTKQRILPASALAPMSSTTIRDLSSDYWFGPLQPIQPVAPDSYRPRQWGYQPGANIIWQPKGDSPITYETLRALADQWDLLRIIIETQKDRVCQTKFEVRAKPKPGESNKDRKQRNLQDPNVKALNEFFAYPDGFHPFADWLRMWLEDMLVIDAVALYMARDKSKKVATINPLAGDTINRMLTDQGITPPPPSVAYQQVVYGQPVWDFTTDDLLYSMRNERTNRRYGFSPVEQILITISIALRRQQFQLNYYTDGNIPEALCFLPPDMPIDRVKEVQEWFDSILAGDLQNRRRMRFLPGYGAEGQAKPSVIFPKEPLLKDEMDEWLARVACFCIGVSPQPFLKMMNRATAQQAQETSEEEGREPYVAAVLNVLNNIIQNKMGFVEYEFVRPETRELDVLKQAQADGIIVGKIKTINEGREDRGLDPRQEPEADMLGVFTQQGFVPLGVMANQPNGDDDNSPDGKKKPNSKKNDQHPDDKQSAKKLAKRLAARIDLSKASKSAQKSRQRMRKKIAKFFTKTADDIASKLLDLNKSVKKAEQSKVDEALQIAYTIYWEQLAEGLEPDLQSIATEYALSGLTDIAITDADMIQAVNTIACDWASDRAAEMVGMKWVDGELVENPNAVYAISDTTRSELKDIITDAFNKETPITDIAEQIKSAGTFSDARAEMIAHTESVRAMGQGNLAAWKNSGVVESVKVLLSNDHEIEDECDEIAEGGPYSLNDLPEYPFHPRCACVLAVDKVKE